jgi:hypothetical protein
MMERSNLVHQWHASRVVFGAGSIDCVADKLQALGLGRALVGRAGETRNSLVDGLA